MVATRDTACTNEVGVSPENGPHKVGCGSGLVGVRNHETIQVP